MGDGAATLRRTAALASVLDRAGVQVANLFAIPTIDLPEVSVAGRVSQGWLRARPAVSELLTDSEALVAAWGMGGLRSEASHHMRSQVCWLEREAARLGHHSIWTLNGQPRHPSRWHQYVSDKHGRAVGSSFEERLASVLTQVPIASLVRHVSDCCQ
jgi:hypothetical protein